MKTAHTPKPWRVVPSTCGGGTARRDVVSDGTEFNPSFVAGDILESDAQLIASAPDLLAALRETLRVLVTPGGLPDAGKGRTPEQQAALDAARAAIARATGGEK